MQIPKDEVKNKIIAAAVGEFLVAGYENSSMRTIATNADITVGNIYSYFSSKDDLFETIVYPTVQQISELIFMDLTAEKQITEQTAAQIANQITSAFFNHRDEFLILMNSAKGSQYEHIKSKMQEQINKRIIAEIMPKLPSLHENEILADTLALVLLEGIINIVLKSENDRQCMNKLICALLLLVFCNIERKI